MVSLDLTMALYRYLKPADDVLPPTTGDLSSSVSPAMIKGHGQYLALNTKIKTAKIYSGGEMGVSRKVCTSKNFPLYGSRLEKAGSEEHWSYSATFAVQWLLSWLLHK